MARAADAHDAQVVVGWRLLWQEQLMLMMLRLWWAGGFCGKSS